MNNIRPTLSNGKLIQFSLADIAKGLFIGMIGNYLLYFYQPTVDSGIPQLLPNKLIGFITIMALLTGISKLIDIITDPIIADLSDKCKSKYGRRMPFLRISAIPYALCVLLIFFAPFKAGSAWNAVWVGVFLVSYYIFHTLFFLPQRALVPEVVRDPNRRVTFFSLSTALFMGANALTYMTPLFVDLFKKAGLTPLVAWRAVFIIYACISLLCLLLSAFAFNEKKYAVASVAPKETFFKSMAIVCKNKEFVMFSVSDLLSHSAMAFFQSALMYYITRLLHIPESQSFIVMICQIGVAMLCFPIIDRASRKYSKKSLIMISVVMFAILLGFISFGDNLAALMPGHEMILGVLIGVFVAYPFAAIHALPQSILSDIVQADSIINGINREGVYAAIRNFVEKLAHALAMVIVSSVLVIGAKENEAVGDMGIKVTAIIACAFCIVSFICYCFFKDKKIMKIIKRVESSKDRDMMSCEGCSGCQDQQEAGCCGAGCGACCGKTPEYDLLDSEVVASFDPEGDEEVVVKEEDKEEK